MFTSAWLLPEFVRESNKIEGILREPTEEEIIAHITFVGLEKPTVYDMINFVKVVQPDARLRDNMSVPGVRVGNHIAPLSGPEVREQLEFILKQAYDNDFAQLSGTAPVDKDWVWKLHCDYETLHPFTDGNGRSGRALWLWCMGGLAPLGFLHQFYYQTLSAYR
jgi:hypothetical protein